MRKALRIQKCDGPTDLPTYRLTRQDVESRVRDYKQIYILTSSAEVFLKLNITKDRLLSLGPTVFEQYHPGGHFTHESELVD